MARKLFIFFCLCLPLLSFTKKKKKATRATTTTTTTTAAPNVVLPYSSDPIRKGQPGPPGQTVNYHAIGSPLPPLRIVTPEGKVITNETVANDANLILMFFNPTCEHCEDMTLALEKNIFLFKTSKIVLISGSMMGPYIPMFRNGLKTDQFPTLQIGLDSCDVINRAFNYESLPQLNIYGPDRKLIKVFNGITEIDSLKPYIQ